MTMDSKFLRVAKEASNSCRSARTPGCRGSELIPRQCLMVLAAPGVPECIIDTAITAGARAGGVEAEAAGLAGARPLCTSRGRPNPLAWTQDFTIAERIRNHSKHT